MIDVENLEPLTAHQRSVLLAVADGTCFVQMSGTLIGLGDEGAGVLAFDASLVIPWRVTELGYMQLAIGEAAVEQ